MALVDRDSNNHPENMTLFRPYLAAVRPQDSINSIEIDDYAKDGGKELFTKMHCVL